MTVHSGAQGAHGAGDGTIGGAGTAGKVAKWSDADSLSNSNITDDDGVTVAADLTVTGDAVITGDFTVQGSAVTIEPPAEFQGTVEFQDDIVFGALSTFSANRVFSSGFSQENIGIGLTAVGTDRATALALTKQINIIATAASSAVGAVLPATSSVGLGGHVDVYNDGPSNAFHVYSAGSDTIDGAAGATGVNLTNAKWCRYIVTNTNTFVSYRSDITRSS